MIVRILGFEPDRDKLPELVGPTAGFEWLVSHPGTEISPVLIGAAMRHDEWYLGAIIRTRDARTLTKMRNAGGVFSIRSERLGADEKITEINFFIAHHETGRGLYTHHQGSASLGIHFARICGSVFNSRRVELMKAAEAAAGELTKKDAVALRKRYIGRFVLSRVLSKGNLKDFLATMKHIGSFQTTFTSFDLEEPLFDPLSKVARRKAVQFLFPPDLSIDLIDDDILTAVNSGQIDGFQVTAYDANGDAARFRSTRNAQVFVEYDYDTLFGTTNISFDDWSGAILSAEAAKRLIALASSGRIRQLLSAP